MWFIWLNIFMRKSTNTTIYTTCSRGIHSSVNEFKQKNCKSFAWFLINAMFCMVFFYIYNSRQSLQKNWFWFWQVGMRKLISACPTWGSMFESYGGQTFLTLGHWMVCPVVNFMAPQGGSEFRLSKIKKFKSITEPVYFWPIPKFWFIKKPGCLSLSNTYSHTHRHWFVLLCMFIPAGDTTMTKLIMFFKLAL